MGRGFWSEPPEPPLDLPLGVNNNNFTLRKFLDLYVRPVILLVISCDDLLYIFILETCLILNGR